MSIPDGKLLEYGLLGAGLIPEPIATPGVGVSRRSYDLIAVTADSMPPQEVHHGCPQSI
jgi:hypothetical protein